MEIKELVAARKDEIIDKLSTLISYPSVLNTNEAPYPFGKNNKDCLDAALKMCDELGFATKNLDDMAGYAEIGQGKELIGVIGHLDVVPVGDGWETDPFTATVKGDKLFGRGSTDDKGPVVCGMIALDIVKSLRPDMNKRIRLIMGTNEETGSACLAHYVEKEGHVDYGFTPDGNFPGCHGEMGMVAAVYSCPTKQITYINAGLASNVVPNACVLDVKKGSYDPAKLDAYFQANNITYTVEETEAGVHMVVNGVSAHASMPQLGVNAISYALEGLKAADMQDPFVDFYTTKIGLGYNGENLGIAFKDEFNPLTMNIGIVRYENGVASGTIDIRFPITMHAKDITDAIEHTMADKMIGNIEIKKTIEPLYFPKESPLIQTLLGTYREVTGDYENDVITMGGGTYAKGIKNTIAFGCEFPGHEDPHIHDANEFVTISDLLLQTEIYVKALLKLLDL